MGWPLVRWRSHGQSLQVKLPLLLVVLRAFGGFQQRLGLLCQLGICVAGLWFCARHEMMANSWLRVQPSDRDNGKGRNGTKDKV